MTVPAAPDLIATDYFRALSEGRVSDALLLFDPDVVWHQPGVHRFSGTHEGAGAVAALLGAMMERSEGTFSIEMTSAPMPHGDLVAVPVRFTAARQGATLDQAGMDLLRVRGGRIVEVRLFSSDGPAEDAFWGARPVGA